MKDTTQEELNRETQRVRSGKVPDSVLMSPLLKSGQVTITLMCALTGSFTLWGPKWKLDYLCHDWWNQLPCDWKHWPNSKDLESPSQAPGKKVIKIKIKQPLFNLHGIWIQGDLWGLEVCSIWIQFRNNLVHENTW